MKQKGDKPNMETKTLTNREKAELEVYKRTIEAFKEIWQNTNPHINLETIETTINPDDYTITFNQFETILKNHNVTMSDNLPLFLNQGPKLVEVA